MADPDAPPSCRRSRSYLRTDPDGLLSPTLRDAETLARPWAVPGTPGLEHRIGGLEREDVTGNVSYAPTNHEHMVRVRARKIAGIAARDPAHRGERTARRAISLILGWGSTYGAIAGAVRELGASGASVAQVHLRHLAPAPTRPRSDPRAAIARVLVPEMNLGQLIRLIRAEYLIDAVGLNKIQGRPFKVSEIVARARKLLEEVR